jgi:N-alpha-acetyl-L-2,4-diaminobutyrate deacetylase
MGLKAKQLAQCTVDFDKDGKQSGFFNLPLSVHDDAWGLVRVPLAVIKNGTGPTVILEGGNHGDEYEGPITLGEMIRDLDPGLVSGRLIFIPAINLPAVNAARRTSPIDDLNMNRTFPGNANGTTTQQISAFVNDALFPMGDAFLDLHSGGSSLDLMPSSVIEPVADPVQHAKNVAAVTAFDAPLVVVIDNRGDTCRSHRGRHRNGRCRHGIARRTRSVPPRRAQRALASRRAAARAGEPAPASAAPFRTARFRRLCDLG